MNKNIIIVGTIALIGGAAAGFFGGMKYQQSKNTQQTFQRGTGRFNAGVTRNNMAIRGEVINKDSNSITVKMEDGSTKIIILGSSTTINKSTPEKVDSITNGTKVTIFGTTNSDGTVTAQNVQIGDFMFGSRVLSTPSANPVSY